MVCCANDNVIFVSTTSKCRWRIQSICQTKASSMAPQRSGGLTDYSKALLDCLILCLHLPTALAMRLQQDRQVSMPE